MEEEEQKVRLFYTVYMSEVPGEISKCIQKLEDVNEQIRSKLNLIDKNIDTDDPYMFLRQVADVKKKLGKMHIMLQDLIEIRNGYYDYLDKLQEPEQENNTGNHQVSTHPREGSNE